MNLVAVKDDKPSFRISEFFPVCSINEIMSCISNVEISANLYRLYGILSNIRCCFGNPIRITSGYRTPDHNLAVKGTPNSQHLRCAAVDFTSVVPGEFDSLVQTVIMLLHVLGVGQVIVYNDRRFIHLGLPCDKYPQACCFQNTPDGIRPMDNSLFN